MKQKILFKFINTSTALTLMTLVITFAWKMAQDNMRNTIRLDYLTDRVNYLSQQVTDMGKTTSELVNQVKELSFELRGKNTNGN